jgi:hypothetical protein
MKRFLPIAAMALMAWSLVALLFWSVEEAIYWVLLSVAVSVLASNLKLAEPDR